MSAPAEGLKNSEDMRSEYPTENGFSNPLSKIQAAKDANSMHAGFARCDHNNGLENPFSVARNLRLA
jgi:hypothetical protein